MRGGNWENTRSRRIETAGDFSVMVNPYLWKQLKIDDGGLIEVFMN